MVDSLNHEPEFTANPGELHRAMSALAGVTSRRNTIPILGHVLLAAKGNALTITATDMDIESSVSAPATVSTAGSTTVSAVTLKTVLSEFKAADEVRAVVNGRAHVSVPLTSLSLGIDDGEFKAELMTLPAEEFPRTLAQTDLPLNVVSMPAHRWIACLKAVRPAISTEETRYYLNGIFLHAVAGRWLMAATDGHRLMQIDTGVEAPAKAHHVIIPSKAVSHILHRLAALPADELITLSVHDMRIGMKLPGGAIASKTIDGTFPDYQRVIPDTAEMPSLEVDVRAWSQILTAALRIERSVSRERACGKFVLSKRGCSVSFDCAGEIRGDTPLPGAWAGADLTVGFNLGYLLELFAVIGPRARLHIKSGSDPAVMVAVDPADELARTAVLMPMRV